MKKKNFNIISGIDSLYYFCATNKLYENFFHTIIDEVNTTIENLDFNDIEYNNNNIMIDIGDSAFSYHGKAEGFHWFKDLNNFFRVGVKDPLTYQQLHNIRVQLQADGIYTIGIKPLIEYINNELLKEYVTGLYPMTRADLNCFINYDFSNLKKEMFVTKKQSFSTINDIGNVNSVQTIYIGKPPFKFRLYDKLKELENSSKDRMMYDYFLNHGLSITEPLWNLEFELHRDHLKSYEIDTLDDLLTNCENLFTKAMEDIRLVDIDSISQKEFQNNKYKATNQTVWDYVKENYSITEFLQIDRSLEKANRKKSEYDPVEFKIDLIKTMKKALVHKLTFDSNTLEEFYDETKQIMKKKMPIHKAKKQYVEAHRKNDNGGVDTIRVFEDGTEIKPVSVISVSKLGDYALTNYLRELQNSNDLSESNMHKYMIAHREAYKRGLVDYELPDLKDF